MAEADDVRFHQLAGPGIEGLDEDPPLFHFDVDSDQMTALINDPRAFLARIGLGPDRGIAPNGHVTVLTNFSQEWTGREWVARDGTGERRNPKGCCYVSDDSVVCHVH